MRAALVTVPVAVVLSLVATPGLCQAPAPTATGVPDAADRVPDRFRIDLGGFRISNSAELTLKAPDPASSIDFEEDLALPTSGFRAFVDLYWRPFQRHQLNFSYARMGRDGLATTLGRDLTWGDYVFESAGAAQGSTKIDYIAGQYRFALVRNDRFEAGPVLGGGYLRVTASIVGEATKDGTDAGVATVESETKQLGFNLGAYFAAWPTRRLQLRGDLAYMKFSPGESDASLMDGRATLTFFPWRRIGFGAGYKYNKLRYDRAPLELNLGGTYRYHGFLAEVSFAIG